jgi:hypothetical protein
MSRESTRKGLVSGLAWCLVLILLAMLSPSSMAAESDNYRMPHSLMSNGGGPVSGSSFAHRTMVLGGQSIWPHQVSGTQFATTTTLYQIMYELTIQVAGNGSTTPAAGDYSYLAWTVVDLSALAGSGWQFNNWIGDVADANSATTTVTMDSDKVVTATFSLQTFTVTVTAGAGGTISPSGIVHVNYGSSQTFTITPNANYHIVEVRVDGTSVGAIGTYSFSNITANHTIEASFAINTLTLSVNKTGTGTGTVMSNPVGIDCGSDCSEVYDHGAVVTLTASPATNSVFAGWSGDCTGTGICTVIIDQARIVTATFNIDPFADDDGDGSNNSAEDNVPNGAGAGNGDGNGDGVADRTQSHVTSLPTASGSGYATLTNTAGHQQINVTAVPVPADAPAGIVFPYSMFSFTVSGLGLGETVGMVMYMPYNPAINGYWKKDNSGQWRDIATSIQLGPPEAPNKTKITFPLTDGGPFDEDLAADGGIDDQGGPGIGGGAPVPTTNQWGMIIFTVLTVISGLYYLRRRKPSPQQ